MSHLRHVVEDEAAGVVGEGVVHGAPPAIEDPHVGLVQLLVVAQDDLALVLWLIFKIHTQ